MLENKEKSKYEDKLENIKNMEEVCNFDEK